MSKLSHTENWQKQESQASRVREHYQQQRVDLQRTQENRNNARLSNRQFRVQNQAEQPQHPTSIRSRLANEVRDSVRQQVSRQNVQQQNQQGEQALRHAKANFRGLNNLARGRLAQAMQQSSQAATPQAATARPNVQQGNNSAQPQQQGSNLAQPQNANPVPNQPANPQPQARPQPNARPNRPASEQPRQPNQPNQPNARTADQARLAQQARQPDASRAAEFAQRFQPPPQPASRGESTFTRDARRSDSEGNRSERRNSSRSGRTSRGGAVYQSQAGGGLGQVLDGGVGSDTDGQGSEDGQPNPAVGRAGYVRDIPEQDESLTVYNEPNPGLETVMAKRNIFEQHVIQRVDCRLQEIQELNDRLADRIRETLPLSERIVGDARGLLERSGDFIRDVNGGIRA